jgi:parallel beta-helix repeat protein
MTTPSGARARWLVPPLVALVALVAPGVARAVSRCDVTVSPGNDVQRAVDAVGGRRVVCLRAGEFRLRRFVALVRDGIVLRGAGRATVLTLEPGTESPVVVVGDWERRVPRRKTSEVAIEDLRIVGAGRDGGETLPGRPYLTNSAVVVRGARNVAIRRVTVAACRSACILTEHDTRGIAIEDDDVGESVWDGIALNRTSRARIVRNRIHDDTAAGISTEHLERSVVADNVVAANRTHGVYLSDSYRNTFSGNRFVANVLSGVFLTCAVRYRGQVTRCWNDSTSAANAFERNRFVGNRVAYMVGADPSSTCARRGFVPNVSRGDVFERNPREDPRATTFGRCLVWAPPPTRRLSGRAVPRR